MYIFKINYIFFNFQHTYILGICIFFFNILYIFFNFQQTYILGICIFILINYIFSILPSSLIRLTIECLKKKLMATMAKLCNRSRDSYTGSQMVNGRIQNVTPGCVQFDKM